MYRNEIPMGRICWQSMGIRTLLQAEMPLQDGIFRAYAAGQQGRCLIGVMEPQDGVLRAKRILSRAEWEALGVLQRGELEMALQEDWQTLSQASDFFHTSYWKRCCPPGKALWRNQGGLRLLALPYIHNGPFPLPELFCFARLSTIEGGKYVVFAFDLREFPTFL